jgi:hypothetical protein
MRIPSMVSLLLAAPACTVAAPACDPLCEEALPVFEGCLVQWGMTWGDAVGYADPEDFTAWCDTWVMEQRTLAKTSADPPAAGDRLDARCTSIRGSFQDDPCAGWWGLWD